MARFTTCVVAAAPATAVWDAVTDWPAHSRHVALTTVTRSTPFDGTPGVGDRFVGRTGIGRLAVDDPMEVVEWSPPTGDLPGRCAIAKLGGVLIGRARIEVTPLSPSTSRVCWEEVVEIPPIRLTRLASPLVSAGGALVFGRVLRALVADAERP